jgi:hypothetical protein
MVKNRLVIYDNSSPPMGNIKVTFHANKRDCGGHIRYVKKATLERHGYLIDDERGLLIKQKGG